jgi:hypothetical protein
MAQITISFKQIKKWGAYVLVATNLFAAGVAVNYLYYRHRTEPVFATMEFDLNDRLPQIRQRLLAKQAAVAAAAARAAEAPAAPAEPTTGTTPPPTKK